MKINFRDRLPVFLFVLGVTLLIIIFTNVASSSSGMYEAKKNAGNLGNYAWVENFAYWPDEVSDINRLNEMDYEDRFVLEQEILSGCRELFWKLEYSDVPSGISGILLPVGSEGNIESVTVILSATEYPGAPLAEGRYWNQNEIMDADVRGVYIGEALKDLCTVDEEGNIYLKVCDERVFVEGVLKSTTFEENRTILLYYAGMSDRAKNRIIESYAGSIQDWKNRFDNSSVLFLGSNKGEVKAELDNLIKELEKEGITGIQIVSYEDSDIDVDGNAAFNRIRFVLLVIVGLFSISNLVQVTYLWIARKRREIVICRAFGMKNSRLFRGLLSEAAVLMIISYALSFIVEFVLYGIGKNVQLVSIFKLSLVAFFFIAILVCCAVGVLFLSLRKLTIIMALRKE